MLSISLQCPRCDWRTTCGAADIERRLRLLGLLRRATHPPDDLVEELFRIHRARVPCDSCGETGLLQCSPEDDDGDWQLAKVCEVCRQPIPPERIEVFPDARRCTPCQDISDRGAEPEVLEYCEKCGALVELRVSHAGGLTRYKRFCTGSPPCRL